VLLFAPALLIGISARYQKELFWGIGHIPVYLEYFGIALLGTGLVTVLIAGMRKKKLQRLLAGFCSLMLAGVLLLQMQDNRAVIEVMNQVYLYSRQLFEDSMEAGAFDELEDGDIVILEEEPLYLGYPGTEYFSYKTQKHLLVYRMETFLEEAYPEGTAVTIVSYEAGKQHRKLTVKEAVYNGNPEATLEDGFTIKSSSTWP
jgi:hypothetical protein